MHTVRSLLGVSLSSSLLLAGVLSEVEHSRLGEWAHHLVVHGSSAASLREKSALHNRRGSQVAITDREGASTAAHLCGLLLLLDNGYLHWLLLLLLGGHLCESLALEEIQGAI